jgi:hypothetical protein
MGRLNQADDVFVPPGVGVGAMKQNCHSEVGENRLAKHMDAGRLTIQPIDPAELSPGEFAHAIRKAVEQDRAGVVVIDSLNGYMNAMPDEASWSSAISDGQRDLCTDNLPPEKVPSVLP